MQKKSDKNLFFGQVSSTTYSEMTHENNVHTSDADVHSFSNVAPFFLFSNLII
jgi:hypothetical protein